MTLANTLWKMSNNAQPKDAEPKDRPRNPSYTMPSTIEISLLTNAQQLIHYSVVTINNGALFIIGFFTGSRVGRF